MALPSSRILSRTKLFFSLADLMFDVEQVLLIFESGLLELQLLRSDLQLQGRIGQHDERLALFYDRAVLNQHLLHGAALIGGEMSDGEWGNHAAYGDVVFERTLGDRADSELVGLHAIDVSARPAQHPDCKTGNSNNQHGRRPIAAPKRLACHGPIHAVGGPHASRG